MDILYSSPEFLKSSLRDGKIVVAVYGLGHVGLAIAAVWLRAGARVIGVDVKDEVVESINRGISPIGGEPGIPETISDYVAKARLRATTDGIEGSRESDVKIIAVPTTLSNQKRCDVSALERALSTIAQGLKRGDLVIIESSVPPTTTATMARKILEQTSKLKTEEDFGLAYSPERIYEGRVLEDIEKRYPKIVGGMGPRSTESAAALYEAIAQKGVTRATSPTAAETSKLFEGIYRDVNIALANELGRFCGAIGIDFKEVREAANSQPFCHLHLPGFVGGWCIPFYPHFVLQVADEKDMKLPLTQLAREINADKPKLLIATAESILKSIGKISLKESKVAILGLTFRGDVADTRNSPSYEVIDLLLKKAVLRISAYDPYITNDPNLKQRHVHLASTMDGATKDADLIIIMADHSIFKDNLTPRELMKDSSTPAAVIDGRNVMLRNKERTMSDKNVQKQVDGFQVFIKTRSDGQEQLL